MRWTRTCVVALALSGSVVVAPGMASADATDDYPIPRRMINTTCTAEQILAAARDVEPIYFERYMIDKHNKSPEVQRAAVDRAHWFFGLSPVDRRTYSENVGTNVFYEQLAFAWPNWAKIFFNNKGVAAHTADVCLGYPPDDLSVWDWAPAP